MSTPFKSPVKWAEEAVGSRLRFLLMASGHVAVFVVTWWITGSKAWGPFFGIAAIFGVMFPLAYLAALRGVLQELQKKTAHEDTHAA